MEPMEPMEPMEQETKTAQITLDVINFHSDVEFAKSTMWRWPRKGEYYLDGRTIVCAQTDINNSCYVLTPLKPEGRTFVEALPNGAVYKYYHGRWVKSHWHRI